MWTVADVLQLHLVLEFPLDTNEKIKKKKRIFENIYLIYIHIYTHTYIFDRELLQLHSHTKKPNLKMGKQVSSEDEMYTTVSSVNNTISNIWKLSR